ncbi:glycosyltransferase family 2 protein [Methanotrichaceae archaeon M04Ac]|uniref:Glycosyltransferase family 2 protein n=1 Tax=Candidatus Methanocrinis alkalitolerans TaxID=3033395 RepID=A0ABT5XGB3_9EURY|nr:glycosyltransferase family 2 protein [Candidatus Methanocrinis alkalitolerans]MDF0593760.1 glycosyltransferase family 2 protein [Candidatus Methanocrinis alkalitolerans]
MSLVSLVIPAMDEEEAIGECISRAMDVFDAMGIEGEVIVADSSSDSTPKVALSLGAVVVKPEKLGYGNAYLAGFARARGEYIVMMDGDLTYDPREMDEFIKLLERGEADLVMGTRLKGTIEEGAMPALHRYVGNPLLTRILNLLFGAGISDAHCGMRAMTRGALDGLHLRAGGMEFASEMVIEASRKKLRIREVPITYSPRKGASKLRSFSDGWRHLRFMMLYRPGPFLLFPGSVALVIGLALTLFVLIQEPSRELRMHSLILGSMLLLIGYQTLLSGIYIAAFGKAYGVGGEGRLAKSLTSYHSLERELIVGTVLLSAGVILGLKVILTWMEAGYGSLQEMQESVMAMVLTIMGIQTAFSAIFISLLLLNSDEGREG